MKKDKKKCKHEWVFDTELKLQEACRESYYVCVYHCKNCCEVKREEI